MVFRRARRQKPKKNFRRNNEHELWFILAWQFGVPVAELKKRISSDELTEWGIFLSIDPPLGRRMDVLAKCIVDAVIILANAWGAKIDIKDHPLIKWGYDKLDETLELEQTLTRIAAK